MSPTLCDPVGYSLPGPSVHGILQARIVKCKILQARSPSPGGLPDSGIEPTSHYVTCIAGRFFPFGATWEALNFSVLLCLAVLCGMWDLSSLTRDPTCGLCIGSSVLTTGPPGKFPVFLSQHKWHYFLLIYGRVSQLCFFPGTF